MSDEQNKEQNVDKLIPQVTTEQMTELMNDIFSELTKLSTSVKWSRDLDEVIGQARELGHDLLSEGGFEYSKSAKEKMKYVTAFFAGWLVKFGERPIDARWERDELIRFLNQVKLPTGAEVFWEKVINDENAGMDRKTLCKKYDPKYKALSEKLDTESDPIERLGIEAEMQEAQRLFEGNIRTNSRRHKIPRINKRTHEKGRKKKANKIS